jgi:hypothetical protein
VVLLSYRYVCKFYNERFKRGEKIY